MAFGRAPTHGCCTFRVSHGEDILLRAASRAILGASWRAERGWGRGDEPDKRIRQSPTDGVGGLRGRDRLDCAGRASRPRVVSRCARPILRDLYFGGGAPRRPGRQIHRRCRRRRLRSADGARGRRAPRGEGRPRDSQRSSGSQRDPDARARNRVGCRRRCEHRRGVRGSRSAAGAVSGRRHVLRRRTPAANGRGRGNPHRRTDSRVRRAGGSHRVRGTDGVEGPSGACECVAGAGAPTSGRCRVASAVDAVRGPRRRAARAATTACSGA